MPDGWARSRWSARSASSRLIVAALLVVSVACAPAPVQAPERFDIVIRNGTVYDGTGGPGRRADVGIRADRVAALGDLGAATAETEIDAAGKAVAPGFINVLSWANESLIVDGRGMSDIKQGVTLEIFGEGESGGPLTEAMKADLRKRQRDYTYDIDWTTLGGFLESLERRGVSPNVASFVGATTVRVHELGEVDRDPSPEELARMQELVREAMREGALGVGSSLIYAPAFFAETPELMALARAAGESGGGYISHIRNESHAIGKAIDEFLAITRAGGGHGEIYHLKAAGESVWPKMAESIAQIERARAAGLPVTADMYTYIAGATGLDAAMPLWVQAGGLDAWVARLEDPAQRARVIADMRKPPEGEENLYLMAGGAGPRQVHRLQGPGLEAPDRKDAGRSDGDAWHQRRGHDHRPRHRGSLARRHRVLPHERGKRPPRHRAALGQLRLGCRGLGARGRVPEVQQSSSSIRQLRAAAR